MRVQFSSRSDPGLSLYEATFLLSLALFLVVACVWPILAWRIHHFSTWQPDTAHTFAVRDHGGLIYLSPKLGSFYVSLPWLWCGLLAVTVLSGFLTGRKPRGRT